MTVDNSARINETVEAIKAVLPAVSKRYTDNQLAVFVGEAIADREAVKALPDTLVLTEMVIELAKLHV